MLTTYNHLFDGVFNDVKRWVKFDIGKNVYWYSNHDIFRLEFIAVVLEICRSRRIHRGSFLAFRPSWWNCLLHLGRRTIFVMVQERSRSFYKVEEDISSLTEFLDGCDKLKSDQDKFLSSYIMRNVVVQNEPHFTKGAPTDRTLVPEAAEKLPIHLSMELNFYSRAKALRTRGITDASADFSFALVETLDKSMSLLPGDYLLKASNRTIPRVYMMDKGVLEIFVDGVSKGSLYSGDVVGKGWLENQTIENKDEERLKAAADWRSPDGLAIADIRAPSWVWKVSQR